MPRIGQVMPAHHSFYRRSTISQQNRNSIMQQKAFDRFDIQRATIRPTPLFTPLRSPDEMMLRAALDQTLVQRDDQVLVMTAFATPRVISTLNMVYHHVAQGTIDQTDWLLTFCMICNSGMIFSSTVGGQKLTFTERGIYNAMTLLSDNQTGSLWNPLTGDCLYGDLLGKRLTALQSPRQMTVSTALEAYPDTRLMLANLTDEQALEAQEFDMFRRTPQPELPDRWIKTMGVEDTRLPRLDIGLGVWVGGKARYYPFRDLNALGNMVIDTLNGLRLMAYIDPDSGLPEAVYIADHDVIARGDELVVKSVGVIKHGVLLPANGEPQHLERPDQLFVRWYGFAFTFPGCEIYAPPRR